MNFDRAVAVGLFLFATAMGYSAFTMPRPLVRQTVGPEVFPFLLMVVLAVAAVALFVRGGSGGIKAVQALAPDESQHSSPDRATQVLVVLGIGLYIVVFETLGYVLSTALLCIYETAVFEAKHWLRNILVGAGFSVGVYVIFVHILNIGLPKGILGW